MKQIFWLDDDRAQMQLIAQSVFPMLWKEEIKSTILFWGDGYKEDPNNKNLTDEDANDFLNFLSEQLSDYCEERLIEDSSHTVTHKELWENKRDILLPRDSVKLLNFESEDDLIRMCRSGFSKDTLNNSDISRLVDAVLECALLPDKCCFALDLCLLAGDDGLIVDEKKATITMLLHREFIGKDYECFLYTAAYNELLVVNWKNVYDSLLGSIDNIQIASREVLSSEKLARYDVDRLIQMCNT